MQSLAADTYQSPANSLIPTGPWRAQNLIKGGGGKSSAEGASKSASTARESIWRGVWKEGCLLDGGISVGHVPLPDRFFFQFWGLEMCILVHYPVLSI